MELHRYLTTRYYRDEECHSGDEVEGRVGRYSTFVWEFFVVGIDVELPRNVLKIRLDLLVGGWIANGS